MSEPISIKNSSFEANSLKDGAWDHGVAHWHKSGSVGEFNPTAHQLPQGVIDGNNVAYLCGHGAKLFQTLDEKYEAGKVYEFSVDIGDGSYTGSGNISYEVNVYAGHTLIGTVSGTTGDINTLKTVTVDTSGSNDPALNGHNLRIEIVNKSGGDLLVDNVKGTVHDVAELDGTVQGTDGDDLIDLDYDGDPEGDRIDNADAILPGAAPNDDLVVAGAGDDTVFAGEGDDVVYGGAGDDDLRGEAGNDVLYGDSDLGSETVTREVLEWSKSGFSSGKEVTGFTQNTGNVTVTVSVLKDNAHLDIEYEGHTRINVDGIDTGSLGPVNDDSSLEFESNSKSEDGTVTLDFSDEVENVSFRIADLDFDASFSIFAFDASGNKVPVKFVNAGKNIKIEDEDGDGIFETVEDTNNSGGQSTTSPDNSVGVEIAGPVAKIVLVYDAEGGNNSQTNISDIYFDTVVTADPVTGSGNDTLDGGEGDDTLFGEGGDDTMFGGSGNDSIDGGAGNDLIYGDNGPSSGTGSPTGSNLIKNGSFENTTGMAKTGYGFVSSTGVIPNWSDVNGEEIDVHNDGRGGLTATDGNNWLDLEASPGNNRIGQDVHDVQAGETYRLTFDAGDGNFLSSSGSAENLVKVFWGGELIATIDPPQGSFQTFTFDVVGGAGNGSDRLEFEGTGKEDNFGASIDSVSLFLLGEGTSAGAGGNDTLFGGEGNDTVFGGDGNDVINTGNDANPALDSGFPSYLGSTPIAPDAFPEDDLDTVFGGAGNDTITTGDDADEIYGGTGNDIIDAGIDNDLVYGDEGDDTIIGSQGEDVVYGGAGNDLIYGGLVVDLGLIDDTGDPALDDPLTDDNRDTLFGGEGDDTIFGRDDDDTLYGGEGNDTLDGGIDDDVLLGEGGDDTLIGGQGNDFLDGADGNDTMFGGDGDDRIIGGAGNDVAYGGDGNDDMDDVMGSSLDNADDDEYYGGAGDDQVFTGLGNDTVYGDDGNDTVAGEGGDDTVFGGAGDDIVLGGSGNDTLFGGDGDDRINDGNGDDIAYGGDGNDTFGNGRGADSLFGDFGDDTFLGGNGGDVIIGGEDPDDKDVDVLDLTGSGVVSIDRKIDVGDGENDVESGLVTFEDGSTMIFREIETVIPCFTPGTTIATPRGEVLVEELKVGDRIVTRDNGLQEVRWVGHKRFTGRDVAMTPHLRPVLIKAGSLGGGLPERDMMVSPNHRVLVTGEKPQLYFEETEVLVAAKHLVGKPGIHRVDVAQTTYVHFMFDRHEVVLSDGAWTESFQPGDWTLKGIDDGQRAEILQLFPELAERKGLDGYTSARMALKKHEARLLVE